MQSELSRFELLKSLKIQSIENGVKSDGWLEEHNDTDNSISGNYGLQN